MTELALRGNATLESGLAFFRRLLKEMFRATPLGMAIAMVADKR